jgi:ABC-type branched-subunit amino acid transport system substrate-binding protein
MTKEPLTDQRVAHGAVRAALVAAGIVVALSSFYIAPHLGVVNTGTTAAVPGTANNNTNTSQNNNPAAGGGGPQASAAAGPNAPAAANAANQAAKAAACAAGQNGGNTDVGVDGKTIHLAATEVESGIGSSFLAPVRYGILSVLQKTNRGGGICGRQLQLTLKDDGWDPQRGKLYLDNFIQSGDYFALAVVPSSEGLNAASGGGDLDNAPDSVTGSQGIPVIGTDGMLNSQYTDPWIWPVAASTATSMRIMAHDAHNRKASRFALIYNNTYKFGVEGAGAFKAQVGRDGDSIPNGCLVPLQAGQTSYKDQVNSFNKSCGNESGHPVDYVALLLEPQTAETWLQDGPFMGTASNGTGQGAGGPQPLFDDNFGNACGQICANMQVWTSFFPPIYPYDGHPEVQTFKRDLCAVDSNCDVDADSAFTEGGYVGMELVVTALKQLGPDVTRQGLKQVLNSMSLTTGLAAALSWSAGKHYANQTMVAFRDTYGQQFTGFQFVSGSSQSDPCSGCKDPTL